MCSQLSITIYLFSYFPTATLTHPKKLLSHPSGFFNILTSRSTINFIAVSPTRSVPTMRGFPVGSVKDQTLISVRRKPLVKLVVSSGLVIASSSWILSLFKEITVPYRMEGIGSERDKRDNRLLSHLLKFSNSSQIFGDDEHNLRGTET